jgi:hypothetical protein
MKVQNHDYSLPCLENTEVHQDFINFAEKMAKFLVFVIILHLTLLITICVSFFKIRATLKKRWFNVALLFILAWL